MNGESGKGDTYRTVDRDSYAKNYDRIFGIRNQAWYACPIHPEQPMNDRVPCSKCEAEKPKAA